METFQGLVDLPLLRHQVDFLKRLAEHPQGFCNFSEMGTGKTLTMIAAANQLAQAGQVSRVLTVCPNSLKHNWAAELKRSCMDWHVVVLDGDREARKRLLLKAVPGKLVWVIVNYEALVGLTKELREHGFELIIADEAHQIKNHKAQKTKALKALPASYRWALTGTPISQNPLDIWSIFDWIITDYLGKSFYAFRARYANVYSGAGFPMIKGWKNLDELKKRLEPYSVRVLKAECLDLPPKIYQTITVDLSAPEQKVYRHMADRMIAEVNGMDLVASTVLTKLTKLQQITSGFVYVDENPVLVGTSKLKVLQELIESLAGHKVIVWCHFKEEVERIAACLFEMKRAHMRFIQEMDEDQRRDAVKQFKESNEDLVFVGSVAIGGVGINLQAASHCIYFSNSWSLIDRQQSEDRLHRYGQDAEAVNYYDLVARETIDEYVLSCIRKKVDLSKKITGDDLKQIIYG